MRIGPRKVRIVLETIRRKPTAQAMYQLQTMKQKAARMVFQTLKSAVANAKIKKMDENRLFVLIAKADGGPTMKRFLTRSMGRADRILKRTSHITIIVSDGQKETLPGAPRVAGAKAQGAKPVRAASASAKKVTTKTAKKKTVHKEK
jgi:large subunit ribosomal protein L22